MPTWLSSLLLFLHVMMFLIDADDVDIVADVDAAFAFVAENGDEDE